MNIRPIKPSFDQLVPCIWRPCAFFPIAVDDVRLRETVDVPKLSVCRSIISQYVLFACAFAPILGGPSGIEYAEEASDDAKTLWPKRLHKGVADERYEEIVTAI